MGPRRLAERSVIVKRRVAIEDLGNVEGLFTDKTGTLAKGEPTFRRSSMVAGKRPRECWRSPSPATKP
jgi:P-type E1-E2 ATPase